MGNHFVKITITHRYADPPPRGWERHESLTFSTTAGTTFEAILDKINEYRRPEYQIKELFNETHTPIYMTDKIYSDMVIYV